IQIVRYAPQYWVNFMLKPDAGNEALLLVGDATPLRYRRRAAYSTVWDRGLFDFVLQVSPDDPQQMIAALRSLGFRYILINHEMLSIWRREGWLNPQITPERMERFEKLLTPLAATPGGAIVLLDLGPSTPSPAR